MNQKILFEIKKFAQKPVFFTDRTKVLNFDKTIQNLPRNSTILIREYDLDKKPREEFAQKIIQLARPKQLKILIGKDFELARKIKANGVHFSDLNKIPLQFLKKKSLPKNFIFSISCHSFRSFLKAKKLKPDIIFISPIFATTSHIGATTFGLKNLAKISFQTKKAKYLGNSVWEPQIFALGGINLNNIKSVRKLAISGFAAIDLFCEEN